MRREVANGHRLATSRRIPTSSRHAGALPLEDDRPRRLPRSPTQPQLTFARASAERVGRAGR